MRTQDALADSVLACKQLIGRYLVGFTDESHTRQAPGLPNHVAWCLGHCALTMHRVSEKLDGRPMPTSDFHAGLAPPSPPGSNAPDRFGTELVAFGSRPTDAAPEYPALARCIEIYDHACDRLAAAARSATAEKLAERAAWGRPRSRSR